MTTTQTLVKRLQEAGLTTEQQNQVLEAVLEYVTARDKHINGGKS